MPCRKIPATVYSRTSVVHAQELFGARSVEPSTCSLAFTVAGTCADTGDNARWGTEGMALWRADFFEAPIPYYPYQLPCEAQNFFRL